MEKGNTKDPINPTTVGTPTSPPPTRDPWKTPLCNHKGSCLSVSFRTFVNGFIVAYGIRTGISILLRAFHLVKIQPSFLLSMEKLFSETELVVRVEAIRLGLLVGGFTGGFKLLHCLLRAIRKKEDGWNSGIAGFLAGSTLLFQEKANRRTIALYLIVRLAQCVYNFCKKNGYFHFWGSSWQYGDSLLFILTSAQIMYAYVMRPDTLPPSYYHFIQRTGPIPEAALQAVRDCNRGKPLDPAAFNNFFLSKFPKNLPVPALPVSSPFPPIIGCNGLHPQTPHCTGHVWDTLLKTAGKTFPLYLTLTFVPAVVLEFGKLFSKPFSTALRILSSSLRSTAFLSTFVAVYQAVICLHRKVAHKDFKLIYFLAGLASSLSILIEKKGRRSELALYALPRSADSLYMILCDHKWLGSVRHGDTLLFCLAMGGLMYFYHNGKDTMSPLLAKALDFLFNAKQQRFVNAF